MELLSLSLQKSGQLSITEHFVGNCLNILLADLPYPRTDCAALQYELFPGSAVELKGNLVSPALPAVIRLVASVGDPASNKDQGRCT